MKTCINNLIIETTRRCNMSCNHCLRGCAENIDQSKQNIDTLLKQVESVSSITFTGGEPSLNVEAITYTLERCKELKIDVSSFYIATNGLSIGEEFVFSCLKWFAYCDEKEMCQVDVSNDMFHAAEGGYNTELLDGLAFFNRKFEKEGYDYNNMRGLIAEGNGANYGGDRFNTAPNIETKEDLDDTEVYLSCLGDIINGCDWSYDSQDSGEHTLCTVEKFAEFVDTLEG